MAGLLRRAWVLELLAFFLLMLAFGRLARLPGDSPPAKSMFLSGYIAASCMALVLAQRFQCRRARRTRPAAIAVVEALDLSSDESRRDFLARATPYARAHWDTVGDRIWRLVEALRWSSPDRRDYRSLEPLLADARNCLAIERRARDSLAGWLEMPRHDGPNLLGRLERWILTLGILIAAAVLWVFSPDRRHPEPFFRAMLLMIGMLAAPLLAGRWFSWRRKPVERELSAALKREGLDHDPLAVDIVIDLIGRERDPKD